MAMLHFFGGEKGGVGKSFVTCTAAQYHLDRKIKFSLFDTDPTTPDVKRIYESCGCRDAIFSASDKYEDKAFSIYSSAQENTTLVNLPANITEPLKAWFEENELFEMEEEDRIDYTIWFICNGGSESFKHLGEYLSYFQGRVNHVLVKNWGVCDDWESLDNNQFLQQKIEKYGVKVIDFPKFKGKSLCNTINDRSLTFGEARELKEFGPINRQRVKTFLKRAYQVFDSAGVFYKDVDVQKVESVSQEREDVKALGQIKKQNKVKMTTSNGQVKPRPESASELA